jgi:hypothetical protein
MPELKDGKVVYSDAELAAATQANGGSQELRDAQARFDAATANVGTMQKLVMSAPDLEPVAQTALANRQAAEKALADAQ